ncbi:MAG: amino acid ABC transporter substrate-binding protein [Oceanospirillaceae bacterium]|nr:amino acid ABC transporter substrate-binding protein [Oceanospirillaceae bacterium]
MKRFLVLITALLVSDLLLAQCRIAVRATSFPPYFIIEQHNNYQGLDVELTNALLKEANCLFEFQKLPWKRGLQLLKIGTLDLMSGMSISVKRQQYIRFIGPMREESMALLVPKHSNYQITSLDDLKVLDKPIGIVSGLFYGAVFAKKYKKDAAFAANFDVANSSQSNLSNLINHRLSAVVGDLFNMVHWLKANKLNNQYEIHPFFINRDDVYFGFSKRNVSADNIANLTAANARLMAAGTYRSIIEQYRQ